MLLWEAVNLGPEQVYQVGWSKETVDGHLWRACPRCSWRDQQHTSSNFQWRKYLTYPGWDFIAFLQHCWMASCLSCHYCKKYDMATTLLLKRQLLACGRALWLELCTMQPLVSLDWLACGRVFTIHVSHLYVLWEPIKRRKLFRGTQILARSL